MSTEFDLSTLDVFRRLEAGLDPRMSTPETPSGQMPIPPRPPADPTRDRGSSLEIARASVDEKHRRVARWLEAHGIEAVVFGTADGVAWITDGGEAAERPGSDLASVLVFMNARSRAVICDNVQTARFFEEEVAGLGFQLKEYPWQGSPEVIVSDLGKHKRLAGDLALPGVEDRRTELSALRFPLSRLERRRIREAGWVLGRAIEAACRRIEPGQTELEVAGDLARHLIRDGVTPLEIRVAANGRSDRFRDHKSKPIPIERQATVTAVGRRRGLCAGASRTVAFGEIDPAFHEEHALAAMVSASAICNSRPGVSIAEVFGRVRRIYEKYGRPDEWMLAPQGSVIGYRPTELRLTPDEPLRLAHGHAVRWTPTVGASRSDDTVLVDDRGFEVVTDTGAWPHLEVAVRGLSIFLPSILRRD